MSAKTRRKNAKKNKVGNVAYNMGHILYMAQLTGNIDRENLVHSMPEHDRHRYDRAFEVLLEDELLMPVERGEEDFFSVNPEKIDEIRETIHHFVRGTKEEIKVKQVPRNPFFHRGPIKNMEHFIGREEIVTHIFDRLRHTEDCSIIGPRAIGKTSLLLYISHEEVVRKNHLDPKRYIFVYLDLQRFGENAQVKDFYYEMFSLAVSQIISSDLITEEEINKINKESGNVIKKINRSLFELGDLESLIAALSERDYRLVYMLDEFETVANNPTFDFSFYGQLRAISGNPAYEVAFISASKKSIFELTFEEEIKTSPFFRYFEDFKLGPMSIEEVRGFFRLAAKNGFIFSSRMRTLIEEWSGGHPFLVQLACDYFFDLAMNQKKLKPGEEEKHLETFLKRHTKHFAYFWKQVDRRQQMCLWKLASSKALDPDCKQVIGDLEESYFVVKKRNNYGMFSKAFEKFVKDKPSPKSKTSG
jgi:hypothetical protein